MEPVHVSRRRWWLLIGTGAVACTACCAGPIMGALGGIGVASAVGAVFTPVLIVLGVLAGTVGIWVVIRRLRTPSCGAPARPTDLGFPATDTDLNAAARGRR